MKEIDHSRYYDFIAEDIVEKTGIFSVHDIIYFSFPSNPHREYYAKRNICNIFLTLIPMRELHDHICNNYGIHRNELPSIIEKIKEKFTLKHQIQFNHKTLVDEDYINLS